MRDLTHHLQHYLPLVGILVAGIAGFSIFNYDALFQQAVVIAVGVSYIAWGIIHHFIHGDLHLSVLLEYIAIATVGVVIILSLVFRA